MKGFLIVLISQIKPHNRIECLTFYSERTGHLQKTSESRLAETKELTTWCLACIYIVDMYIAVKGFLVGHSGFSDIYSEDNTPQLGLGCLGA